MLTARSRTAEELGDVSRTDLHGGWHQEGKEFPGVSAGMNALLAASPTSSQLQPRARRGARLVRAPRAGNTASIPHLTFRASSRRRWISPGKGLVGLRISGVVGLCVAVMAEKQN